MKRTLALIGGGLAAAIVFAGLVRTVLMAAHVSEPAATTVHGLTFRRLWATPAAGLGLLGVIIGGLALARSRRAGQPAIRLRDTMKQTLMKRTLGAIFAAILGGCLLNGCSDDAKTSAKSTDAKTTTEATQEGPVSNADSTVVSVRYIVDDVDAAVAFYTKHLGFTADLNAAPAFASVRRGNLRLLLSGEKSSAWKTMADGTKPMPGGWNRIQIHVTDIKAEAARLRAAGVKFRRDDIVKGPAGSQIWAVDPSGNLVEVFEPGLITNVLDPANIMAKSTIAADSPVVVRYMIDDVDAAVGFYTGRLGFTKDLNTSNLGSVHRGNLHLILSGKESSGRASMADGTKPVPGGWNRIVLLVSDVKAEVARLRAAGVKFRYDDIISGPGGSQIWAIDPSGNLVELFQPRE